jgi:DNA repair protein RadA/Sms
VAAFGEIGLTGRLRPATQAERRLEECAKLGLRTVVVPAGTKGRRGVDAKGADSLRRALVAGLAAEEAAAEPAR